MCGRAMKGGSLGAHHLRKIFSPETILQGSETRLQGYEKATNVHLAERLVILIFPTHLEKRQEFSMDHYT